MNKNVFILILSMTTNALLNSPVKAQVCGGGTFTFEIYTLNGRKLENINYEILPVNSDSIKNISHNPHPDLYKGEMINAMYFKKAVDTSGEKELIRQLAFRDNKKTGIVKDGIIKFKTLELAYLPCILHLYSNKKEVYILTNIVGGCNRKTGVLWNDFPLVVKTY